MASCRSSFFLPLTRSSSPWIETWTFSLLSLMSLTMRLARVWSMPCLTVDFLAQRVAGGLLRLLEIEGGGLELAPDHVAAQQFLHLAQLHVVVGEQGDQRFLALDRCISSP